MRRSTALGLVLGATLGICGCGGSPTSPSNPTPVASVAGSWSGIWTITACGQTGAWASPWEYCSVYFGRYAPIGTGPFPLTLTLSQDGTSVTGTLTQQNIPYSVSGSIGASGRLILSGGRADDESSVQFLGFDAQLSGNTLSGGWDEKITRTDMSGFAQLDLELSATRGSAPN